MTQTPPQAPPRLNWLLVLELGSLALLWPLAHLIGLADAIGQPATALLLLAAVGVTWVGVVGLGRVPRPVLTLAAAGAVYGTLLVLLSIVLGDRLDEAGGPLRAIAAVYEIGQAVLLGSLAGLLARAVQTMPGRR